MYITHFVNFFFLVRDGIFHSDKLQQALQSGSGLQFSVW